MSIRKKAKERTVIDTLNGLSETTITALKESNGFDHLSNKEFKRMWARRLRAQCKARKTAI